MKRTRRTIPPLVAAAMLLVACGGGGETDGVVGFYHDKAQWEAEFAAVSAVSQETLGTELNVVGYADDAAYDSFIRSSFLTDQRPDLFTWHTGGPLAELVEEGLVAESGHLWDAAIADGDVPADIRSFFEIDGATYCVPLLSDYWVMYYSVPIFDEYGFEPPQTWDELMRIADTLLADGQIPFSLPGGIFSFVWFQQLMLGMYPDVYEGLADGTANYTDPEVVEVMELWRELAAGGYTIEPGVEIGPAEMMRDGVVAMQPFGTWFHGPLNGLELTSGEDYDVFVMPSINPDLSETSVVVELGPLCQAEAARNADAAQEVLRWWMQPEAQTEFTVARNGMSYNPNAEAADPRLVEVSDQIATGHRIHNRYFEASPPQVSTVAMEQFDAFMADLGDPMDYLEQIQRVHEQHWSE
ncbi:ABC transporter substrate-binding protein [Phytoactinopolyspora limicola]|uniref:ABC transporter substrate-binding protein n=1 Tax=Phytoactinopolyspora limicola TaxID=2715536 RepID=UPI00140B0166|nr:extracellular solute-binding protein [Phytoactinopolyspora limicola]